MLLKRLREERQFGFSQSAENLAGHRGIQHHKLPATLNHVTIRSVVLARNLEQVIDMIVITSDPD